MNLCHEVVPGSWTNHRRIDLKGGGANPVPNNAKVNVPILVVLVFRIANRGMWHSVSDVTKFHFYKRNSC